MKKNMTSVLNYMYKRSHGSALEQLTEAVSLSIIPLHFRATMKPRWELSDMENKRTIEGNIQGG